MAGIDYGTLIIKNGKVLNDEDTLFPDLIIGDYILYFYKKTLTIFNRNTKQDVENYWFYDNKYSWHLDTVVGPLHVKSLDRDVGKGSKKGKERARFITRIDDYTIVFGYGIDPSLDRKYQKEIMDSYGFSKREKRIVSRYLWGKENDR